MSFGTQLGTPDSALGNLVPGNGAQEFVFSGPRSRKLGASGSQLGNIRLALGATLTQVSTTFYTGQLGTTSSFPVELVVGIDSTLTTNVTPPVIQPTGKLGTINSYLGSSFELGIDATQTIISKPRLKIETTSLLASTRSQLKLFEFGSTGSEINTSPLSATIDATSTISAFIVANGILSDTISGVAAISSTLIANGILNSESDGLSTVSASIIGTAALTETINNTSTISGSILASGALAATSNGTNTISSILLASGKLAGESDGLSTISATINGLWFMTDTISGTSSISASATASGSLASESDGFSTVISVLSGAGSLSSTSNGTDTMSANITANATASSQINGTATNSANILGAGDITSEVFGQSNISGYFQLSSNINGISNVVLTNMIGTGHVTSQIDGLSSANGNITGTVTIFAASHATSDIFVALSGIAACNSIIDGSSYFTIGVVYAESKIFGTSSIIAWLVDYLQDKAILNPIELMKGSEHEHPFCPPCSPQPFPLFEVCPIPPPIALFDACPEPPPPAPPPPFVTEDNCIKSSHMLVAHPHLFAFPLIEEVPPPPPPPPPSPPPAPIDIPISSSGIRLH
jgi:hypothetical protein